MSAPQLRRILTVLTEVIDHSPSTSPGHSLSDLSILFNIPGRLTSAPYSQVNSSGTWPAATPDRSPSSPPTAFASVGPPLPKSAATPASPTSTPTFRRACPRGGTTISPSTGSTTDRGGTRPCSGLVLERRWEDQSFFPGCPPHPTPDLSRRSSPSPRHRGTEASHTDEASQTGPKDSTLHTPEPPREFFKRGPDPPSGNRVATPSHLRVVTVGHAGHCMLAGARRRSSPPRRIMLSLCYFALFLKHQYRGAHPSTLHVE